VSEGSLIKRIVAHGVRSPLLKPIRKPLLHTTQFALGLTQREIVSFSQNGRADAAKRIREIVTGFPVQTVGVAEAYLIRNAVIATSQVPGLLAEVGVFRGGTARVISEVKGSRVLHLFDTFEGLPPPGGHDTAFEAGEYACSLESVQAYLADCTDVHYHQGLFPDTSGPVEHERFSFVHLDVDLYESTLASLGFFYPRMSRGAMLISHDYVEHPPVKQAFDEYFQGTGQPVLELSGNQCLVVKIAD